MLNFWQYTDLYGSWHGLPVDGSSVTNPEFGVINLPNPAYTDAAHRNGVLSLGGWFWPRAGQNFSDWVEKKPDGSFPVADKMIEMAQYFGFDGYFINQEASISKENAQKLMEMIKYLRAKAPEGFHLQWYDSLSVDGRVSYVNGFSSSNAPWIVDNGVLGQQQHLHELCLERNEVGECECVCPKPGLGPVQGAVCRYGKR